MEPITLRDLFAAHALSGIMSDSQHTGTSEDIATICYGVADAMIAERNMAEEAVEDEKQEYTGR